MLQEAQDEIKVWMYGYTEICIEHTGWYGDGLQARTLAI
jgi:hypothetical protein